MRSEQAFGAVWNGDLSLSPAAGGQIPGYGRHCYIEKAFILAQILRLPVNRCVCRWERSVAVKGRRRVGAAGRCGFLGRP